MRHAHTVLSAALFAAFLAATQTATAQGKGKGAGQEHGKAGHGAPAGKASAGKGNAGKSHANSHATQAAPPGKAQARGNPPQGKGHGKSEAAGHGKALGRAGAPGNALKTAHGPKPPGRVHAVFGGEVMKRAPVRYAGSLVFLARKHGAPQSAIVYTPLEDRVLLRNRRGDVLLALDDSRLRDMGAWQVVRLDDDVKRGAPAFCRSGAGHPVWGRQWCIDKGFGLGADGDFRWGRTVDPRDIVIVRPTTTNELLAREVLAAVLGQTAFDRLAVHALTLGLVEPLVGRFIGDATGPDVLVVSSGPRPVAEFVDLDRDNRADQLYILLPR